MRCCTRKDMKWQHCEQSNTFQKRHASFQEIFYFKVHLVFHPQLWNSKMWSIVLYFLSLFSKFCYSLISVQMILQIISWDLYYFTPSSHASSFVHCSNTRRPLEQSWCVGVSAKSMQCSIRSLGLLSSGPDSNGHTHTRKHKHTQTHTHVSIYICGWTCTSTRTL